MGERRWGNYSSCCRLCLSEKMGSLKPIFEDAAKGEEVTKNVLAFVEVNITINDKLSTMICTNCLSKVDTWHDFRKVCSENQNKLTGWMNAWSSNNIGDTSIQIKDEILDDDGTALEVLSDDDEVVQVKREVVDSAYEPQAMEEDIYDLPPPLTPHPPDEEIHNNIMDEDEDDNDDTFEPIITENEPTTLPQINGCESPEAPPSPPINKSSRSCPTCNKTFSSVGNRRKHEAMMHRRERNTNKTPKGREDQSKDASETLEPRAKPQNETEIQKIQFAAGLHLQQKSNNDSVVPIENTPLTKIEISYLERYKTMVKMVETLMCVCHSQTFKNFKLLLIHLKKQHLYFSLYTCYNCLITFSDKSSYMKHYCCCKKELLQNLKRISESPVNPEIKMRLYQSFKCIKCTCVFGFHEDFCSHFDQAHMELVQVLPPFVCHCARSFDNMDDYKQHLHINCFLRYFCDICYQSFAGTDSFKSHCEREHDGADGCALDEYDTFYKSKYIGNNNICSSSRNSLPTMTGTEAEKEETSRSMRRRTVPLESDKGAAPRLEVEDENYASEPLKVINPHAFFKTNQPTVCPLCGKIYSSYHNMVRHYKILHDRAGKILGCTYCSQRFRLLAELKDHQAATHPQEVAAEMAASKTRLSSTTNNSQLKFSCPDCGDLFKSLEEWTSHTQTHPKKSCDECGKQFALQSELDQHRSVHLNIKVYRDAKTQDYRSAMVEAAATVLMCEICDKTFNSRTELRQHNLLHEKMPVLSAHNEDNAATAVAEEKKDRKYSCVPCNKHYLTYGGIWDHNKRHHKDASAVGHKGFPIDCYYCGRMIKTRAAWVNHRKMHERLSDTPKPGGFQTRSRSPASCNSDSSESYYTCNKCFKVFSSKYNLKNHMKCHGMKVNLNRSSSKTGKILKTYWCDICHQACPGYAELQEHKREHRSESAPTLVPEQGPPEHKKLILFPCNQCSLKFSSNFMLKRHMEKHADQDKTKTVAVYCKYCKIPFDGTSDLNEHMLKEHDETHKVSSRLQQQQQLKTTTVTQKRFPCRLCKKVFDNPGALSSHQGWHKRGKVERKIRTEGKLLRTIVNQIPERSNTESEQMSQFRCYSCSKSFPTDTRLQVHILEDHRNIATTVLNCTNCKISFETKGAYDAHMHLHSLGGDKKQTRAISCKYCPSKFSRSDTLNGHVKQHHKEYYQDTYKCNQCDRAFDKQNALTIHLKVHDKHRSSVGSGIATSKPIQNKDIYFCSICKLGFAIAKDLRNHVVFAHPF